MLKICVFILALMGAGLRVAGDDTKAFQDMLSSLCNLNSLGAFGRCCSTYNATSITFSDKQAIKCYAQEVSAPGNSLTYMFVFSSFFSLSFQIHYFFSCNFYSRGLTLLESGVFSGLSNLVSL